MFTNKWYITRESFASDAPNCYRWQNLRNPTFTVEKQCDPAERQCTRVLAVILEDDAIILYPDMHVDVNQYSFTPNQLARLGDKFSSFKISAIGDITYFVSNNYGFWVIWDSNSNAKVGVSTKLAGPSGRLVRLFRRTHAERQATGQTEVRPGAPRNLGTAGRWRKCQNATHR